MIAVRVLLCERTPVHAWSYKTYDLNLDQFRPEAPRYSRTIETDREKESRVLANNCFELVIRSDRRRVSSKQPLCGCCWSSFHAWTPSVACHQGVSEQLWLMYTEWWRVTAAGFVMAMGALTLSVNPWAGRVKHDYCIMRLARNPGA